MFLNKKTDLFSDQKVSAYGNSISTSWPSSFPIYTPPQMFFEVAAAVSELSKAPAEMIYSLCFAVAATACQGLFDVILPHGQVSPLCINMVTLAESGAGKTYVHDLIAEPLMNWDRHAHASFEESKPKFQAEHRNWTVKNRGLTRAIEKAVSAGTNTDDLDSKYFLHMQSEPKQQKSRVLTQRDITPAGLKKVLFRNEPLGVILSDEAGDFFSGGMMNEYALLNNLWNGKDLNIERGHGDGIRVQSPRVSLALMVQPQVFFESMQLHGNKLRDSGFLARCLFSLTSLGQGDREPTKANIDRTGLNEFSSRISELLELTFAESGRDRHQLRLAHDAHNYLIDESSKIRLGEGIGGIYYNLQDFTKKMIEQACRLAAIFHVIEGGTANEEITIKHVKSAMTLVYWYADEFNRIINNHRELSLRKRAETLYSWFSEQRRMGLSQVTKSFMMKSGPNFVRKKADLEPALDLLLREGSIVVYTAQAHLANGRITQYYSLPHSSATTHGGHQHYNGVI